MSKNYYNYGENMKYGAPSNSGAKQCVDDSYVVGNSIDFTIDNCDSEIKADVTVSYRESVRVWGQVRDCSCQPVPYAYLKLIKVTSNGEYVGVAHTIADCLGFYQFDICPCTDGTSFRLLVGKASTGGEEKIVSTGLDGTNCNPCVPCGTPKCDCR
ncbi:hypothetical protein [Clostridium taeniosporum]|uniref:Uncharacterized protein n=1 Tax=Clostridium taeniosporum TaxID=394958 RepID=A0A1D7XL01_9CLOT|nr:hypothetical protein [Clostridium taeniosporum]AOR24022.1 hypothetical protein BGI42_09895 [Clostridium taeniosporum]